MTQACLCIAVSIPKVPSPVVSTCTTQACLCIIASIFQITPRVVSTYIHMSPPVPSFTISFTYPQRRPVHVLARHEQPSKPRHDVVQRVVSCREHEERHRGASVHSTVFSTCTPGVHFLPLRIGRLPISHGRHNRHTIRTTPNISRNTRTLAVGNISCK